MKNNVLLLILLIAIPLSAQVIPTAATLPASTPDPTYPAAIQTISCVGTVAGVCDHSYAGTSAGLVSAIAEANTNRATWGNTGAIEIKIDPAGIYTKAGSAYSINSCGGATTELILRTGATTMPVQGTRITAANYADMPVIEASGLNVKTFTLGYPHTGTSVLSCNIRLMGLYIRHATGTNTSFLVHGGDADLQANAQDTEAEVPYGIWIDRSFVGSDDATQTLSKAAYLDIKNGGVVDSILTGAKSNSFGDTSCLGFENTPGPFLFQNNTCSSAGESMLIGGSGLPSTPTTGDQYVPSDLTFRRNLFYMDAGCPTTWQCKNVVEFKIGQRILFEGNILQHSRIDAQDGLLLVIKTSNSGKNNPWTVTAHMTVRYNVLRDAEGICVLLQAFNNLTYGSLYMHHITVYDNLCDGTSNGSSPYASPAGQLSGVVVCTAATGCPAAADRIIKHVYFNHNTIVASSRVTATQQGGFSAFDNSVVSPLAHCSENFAFHDNIVPLARDGNTATTSAFTNCKIDGVRSATNDGLSWSDGYDSFWTNLLTNASASGCTGATLNTKPMAQHAVGCATAQGSQFTTFSSGNIGTGANDYTLLASSDGYQSASDAATRTAAGRSTDVGADIAKVNDETCGTLAGDWTACTGQPAPTVSSITPSSGSNLGGTSITDLAGTGFIAGTPSSLVTFGGTAGVDCVVVSTIKITCTTPAHAAGAVDVVVTNPDLQTDTLAGGYTYTGSGAPTISTIVNSVTGAARGSAFGRETVTITGTNFAVGATVTILGSSCDSVVVNSSTEIVCITQARSVPAQGDVIVTNPNGQSATLTNGFTYTKPVIGRP